MTIFEPGRSPIGGHRVRTASLLVALVIAMFGILAPDANAVLFWVNEAFGSLGGIGRANLDGSNVLVPFVPTGGPLEVVADGKYLYWTNYGSNSISRDTIDGSASNVDSNFITGANQPYGLAVDGNYIYWTNSGNGTIGRDTIDGNPANVIQGFIGGANDSVAIAVDTGHIYWANAGGIGRANLDGGGVNQDFVPANTPEGVAVDGNYIYWSDYGGSRIGRDTIDGNAKNINDNFITGANLPVGIAVNGSYIYWANHNSVNNNSNTIGRDTIDGNPANINQSFITTGVSAPYGVAVAPAPISAGPPSAGGSAVAGQTLTESHASWWYSPTSFAYQWERCDAAGSNCAPIAGAISPTYTLGAADVANTVRVEEIASNPYGGSSQPATSAPTLVVQGTGAGGGGQAPVTLDGVSSSGPTATLAVTCHALSGQTCDGDFNLTVRERKRGRAIVAVIARKPTRGKTSVVTVTVGSATVAMLAGQTSRLAIGLNATGKRLLAQFYKLRPTLSATGVSLTPQTIMFSYRLVTSPPDASWATWTWADTPCAPCWTIVDTSYFFGVPRLVSSATVTVRCTGTGCPPHRSFKPPRRSVDLRAMFAGRRLEPGAVIKLLVTAPNSVGRLVTWTTRAGAPPVRTVKCLPPGARTPLPCAAGT